MGLLTHSGSFLKGFKTWIEKESRLKRRLIMGCGSGATGTSSQEGAVLPGFPETQLPVGEPVLQLRARLEGRGEGSSGKVQHKGLPTLEGSYASHTAGGAQRLCPSVGKMPTLSTGTLWHPNTEPQGRGGAPFRESLHIALHGPHCGRPGGSRGSPLTVALPR